MRKLVSLGFSCQSRFCIYLVIADHRLLPFDYNVTTKAALLAAFRYDGEIFSLRDEDVMEVYRAPKEGREGIHTKGVYLWHDYAVTEDLKILPNWREGLPLIRQEYAAMWGRFRSLLRSPDEQFTFVISNTQINLGEYARDFQDFSDKFRITRDFILDLKEALTAFGVRDFEILVLNRNLRDSIELNHAFLASWFRSVFAGKLTLPTNGKLAASVFSVGAADSTALTSVAGVYESGWRIVPLSDHGAAITKAGESVGELRSMQGGYIAVFDDDAEYNPYRYQCGRWRTILVGQNPLAAVKPQLRLCCQQYFSGPFHWP